MNVRELLQSKKEAVITIDAEDTIGAAAHKMSANRIAALVVMKDDAPVGIMVTDGNQLVGILSLGDIVKNLLGELELEKAVLQDIYMAAH